MIHTKTRKRELVDDVDVFAMPDDMDTKGAIACLPETYTNIPPATLMRQDPAVPKQENPNKAVHQIISQAMEKEYRYVYCFDDKCVKKLLHVLTFHCCSTAG